MKIAIIGHGNVGGALAQQWANAGHEITIGARNLDNEKVKTLVGRHPSISAKPIKEASQEKDAILIATPSNVVADIARLLGDVSQTILIDATNSIRQKPEPYQHGVEALKALTNAKGVVKCFNSTGFENMLNPQYGSIAVDMYVAGDSPAGKALAITLAQDAGFGPVYDFGGDDKVGLLEQFALAWINLAIMQGHGRNMAFKILKRD